MALMHSENTMSSGSAVTLFCVGLALPTAMTLGACNSAPLDAIGLAPTSLGTGLIAHYTFDEGAGTIVNDHSGYNHGGVLTGGTWLTDGRFGGAIHFDGASSIVIQQFPNATTSFSVSAWIRSSATPVDGGIADFQTVLSTEIANIGGWELNIGVAPVRFHTGYWDNVSKKYTHEDCSCAVPNQWTHVVSVHDGSAQTLMLYIDGALPSAPTSAAGPISVGTIGLLLGRWSGSGRWLVGDVDDVAIYSRALDPAEVRELTLRPPPDPG